MQTLSLFIPFLALSLSEWSLFITNPKTKKALLRLSELQNSLCERYSLHIGPKINIQKNINHFDLFSFPNQEDSPPSHPAPLTSSNIFVQETKNEDLISAGLMQCLSNHTPYF